MSTSWWLAEQYLTWCKIAEERTKPLAERLIASPVLVPWLRQRFLRWYTYVALVAMTLVTCLVFISGLDGARFTFTLMLYQRIFGAMITLAHLSIAVQIMGLIGSQGILSASEFMEQLKQNGFEKEKPLWKKYLKFPTLCWISATDDFLRLKIYVGIGASVLFTLGVLPNVTMFISMIIYLSWKEIGRKFFQLQFDNIILEAGYSAMLMYPFELLSSHSSVGLYSYIEIFICWVLIIRLHIGAGACKVTSNDKTWNGGYALTYHYWTTPIPNWTGWYAHHMPLIIHWFSAHSHFAIELLTTLLVFIPTNFTRVTAVFFITVLQGMIISTGNFGSFNYFTVICSLPFLDDSAFPSFILDFFGFDAITLNMDWSFTGIIFSLIALCHLFLVLYLSLPIMWRFFDTHNDEMTNKVAELIDRTRIVDAAGNDRISKLVSSFDVINYYGVFARMTTTRDEIIIEGWKEPMRKEGIVVEGGQWLEYQLHYKPGDVKRPPTFLWPGHLPRLDWMLWFCGFRKEAWTRNIALRLLQGSRQVHSLLAYNPFPDPTSPPKFIRMTYYAYRFTNPEAKKKTGEWWVRERVRPYDVTVRLSADGQGLVADEPYPLLRRGEPSDGYYSASSESSHYRDSSLHDRSSSDDASSDDSNSSSS